MSHSQHSVAVTLSRISCDQGWNCRGGFNPQFVSTDGHFWVKIGLQLQSLGKISNILQLTPQFF